jgi:hypothetical protein
MVPVHICSGISSTCTDILLLGWVFWCRRWFLLESRVHMGYLSQSRRGWWWSFVTGWARTGRVIFFLSLPLHVFIFLRRNQLSRRWGLSQILPGSNLRILTLIEHENSGGLLALPWKKRLSTFLVISLPWNFVILAVKDDIVSYLPTLA